MRKDNTVLYLSNRYSVPLGTYHALGKMVQLKIDQTRLIIYDSETGETLGNHNLSKEKGKLIQDKNHLRDRTKGISAMMESTIGKFEDQILAQMFMLEIKKKYPRYIRDQLQLVNQQWNHFPSTFVNSGLKLCVEKRLFSASDLKDMILFLTESAQHEPIEMFEESPAKIKPLDEQLNDILEIKPSIRSLETYLPFLEGGTNN